MNERWCICKKTLLCIIILCASSHVTAFGSRPVQPPVGIDGGSPGDPECVFRARSFSTHLSVYQSLGDASLEKHCQDLPNVGRTHLVFDLHSIDKKIRDVPLRFRIFEDPSSEAGFVPATETTVARPISETPAKTYKTGVVEIDVIFKQPGRYAVLVDSDDPSIRLPSLRIPLTVASKTGLMSPLLAGV